MWLVIFSVSEYSVAFRSEWPRVYRGREALRSMINISVLMTCGVAHLVWGWYHSDLLVDDEQWPLLECVLWSMMWYNIGDTFVLWCDRKLVMHWRIHHSMLFACIGSILYTRAFPQFVPICCSFEVTSFLFQIRNLAKQGLVAPLRNKKSFASYHRFYTCVYIVFRGGACVFAQVYLWAHLLPMVRAYPLLHPEAPRDELPICFWIEAVGAEGLVLFSVAAMRAMNRHPTGSVVSTH